MQNKQLQITWYCKSKNDFIFPLSDRVFMSLCLWSHLVKKPCSGPQVQLQSAQAPSAAVQRQPCGTHDVSLEKFRIQLMKARSQGNVFVGRGIALPHLLVFSNAFEMRNLRHTQIYFNANNRLRALMRCRATKGCWLLNVALRTSLIWTPRRLQLMERGIRDFQNVRSVVHFTSS